MLNKNNNVDNSMENMICIGTVGHIDHGKTTLTSAITKALGKFLKYDEIDDIKEEKERGITISAKHILYKTSKRTYTHVDCPGHADYIKNMIVGSSRLDIAILVVSLTDGVMPQTKEHLNLIKSIGVPSLAIFFNKADAEVCKDSDYVDMIVEDTLDVAKKYKYENVPYVIGSAYIAKESPYFISPENKLVDEKGNEITDEKELLGLPKVKQLLDIVDELPIRERELNKPFLMQIEGVNSITGRGTVAVGRVIRGIVNVGTEIEVLGNIKGDKIKTTVTSIEMFNQQFNSAKAGNDVALLLRGIEKKQITRGCVLAAINSIKSISKIKAIMYVYSKQDQGRSTGFKKTYKPQFYFRAADVTGTFDEFLGDLEIINPGEVAEVIISLNKKQAIEKDDSFIVRESGITVAIGKVLEILD